jgi:hypothetical protein
MGPGWYRCNSQTRGVSYSTVPEWFCRSLLISSRDVSVHAVTSFCNGAAIAGQQFHHRGRMGDTEKIFSRCTGNSLKKIISAAQTLHSALGPRIARKPRI